MGGSWSVDAAVADDVIAESEHANCGWIAPIVITFAEDVCGFVVPQSEAVGVGECGEVGEVEGHLSVPFCLKVRACGASGCQRRDRTYVFGAKTQRPTVRRSGKSNYL